MPFLESSLFFLLLFFITFLPFLLDFFAGFVSFGQDLVGDFFPGGVYVAKLNQLLGVGVVEDNSQKTRDLKRPFLDFDKEIRGFTRPTKFGFQVRPSAWNIVGVMVVELLLVKSKSLTCQSDGGELVPSFRFEFDRLLVEFFHLSLILLSFLFVLAMFVDIFAILVDFLI